MTDSRQNYARSRPLPRVDVSVIPLDNDLVAYDPQSGQAFVLNATGRIIWSLCDGERSLRTIAGELSVHCGISYEQALTDVSELVSELRHANLLHHDSG